MDESTVKIIEEEMEQANRRATKELKSMKRKICRKMKSTKAKVAKIYDSARCRIFEQVDRVQEDKSSPSAQMNMTLLFKNIISQTILTSEKIKGDDNNYIELNLVNDSTGEVVEIGPESSINVEVVLLKGEFGASESLSEGTVEEFNENIFRDEHGKMDLLRGNVNIKLQKGVAILSNIKLRNRASGFKPPIFALGARVVQKLNGVNIKEAKTNSFTVENYRKKYYMKSEFPSLSDEVYRLENIRKGGAVCKLLNENSINTVEDFLVRLMRDPKGLQNIMKLPKKKFDATAIHARKCQIGQKIFCYTNSDKTASVVFDVLGTILGLYYENQYSMADSLAGYLKVFAQGLFKSALENWKDVESVKDDNALQQYFTDCGAMGGESSNMPMYGLPFQSIDLPMNCPIREAVVAESDHSFCVDDVEMDRSLSQHNPSCLTMLQDFDKFLVRRRWNKVLHVIKWLCPRKNKER